MTTSWTTRAGGITLVALIAAAGCSSKTHPNSTGSSAPATVSAASTPAVSSPAPATSAVASAGGSASAPPASTPAPTNAATTSPSVAPTSAAVSLDRLQAGVGHLRVGVPGLRNRGAGVCDRLRARCSRRQATPGRRGPMSADVAPVVRSYRRPSPAITKVRFATKNDGWAFGPATVVDPRRRAHVEPATKRRSGQRRRGVRRCRLRARRELRHAAVHSG